MNDENGPTPRATPEEIAHVLRDRIRAGALRTGERLPTQAALAEEFGVERGAVRQALQRLQADGLLANVSRGSPPQVATVPPAQGSRDARSILGPRLVTAFGEPRVRIDVACLTAETLMTALGEPLRSVYEGTCRPDSVRIRVLLPSLEQNLDYPAPFAGWGHDDLLDAAVKRRNQGQREAQRTVLRNSIAGLRRSGVDAEVEFRYTVGTPARKAYLLNRREALIGHYVPGRYLREVEDFAGANPVELCDVEGFGTAMFAFERSENADEAAFVRAEQTMFDGIWDYVAHRQG